MPNEHAADVTASGGAFGDVPLLDRFYREVFSEPVAPEPFTIPMPLGPSP